MREISKSGPRSGDSSRKLILLNYLILEQQQLSKQKSASLAQDELRRLSAEMRKVESEISSKNEQIEKLNRDMRKVNLQSFVRETNSSKSGSKVWLISFYTLG